MADLAIDRGQNHGRELEVELLLGTIIRLTGTSLMGLARPLLQRRLVDYLVSNGVDRPAELIPRVVAEPAQLELLVDAILVKTTALFRDVSFYRRFRQQVVPYLQTYPRIRLWDVGCSTGLETYSLAIVLEEEGVGERAMIFGTDINRHALQQADKRVHPRLDLEASESRYRSAGGTRSLAYYLERGVGEGVRFRAQVTRNVAFARHDVATDASIGVMNVVICRNVLIYLANEQRRAALALLDRSLQPNGFLVLGETDELQSDAVAGHYQEIATATRIYQRRSPEACVRRHAVLPRRIVEDTVSMPPIELARPPAGNRES